MENSEIEHYMKYILNELQLEANEIFTKNKYFGNKGENDDI